MSQAVNLPKLLPCPFCGGEELEIASSEDSEVYVQCLQCYGGKMCGESNALPEGEEEDAYGMNSVDKAQAAESWNTRHTDPQLQAQAEKLKALSEALDGLMGRVPTLWGDHVFDGLVRVELHEDDIHRAEAALRLSSEFEKRAKHRPMTEDAAKRMLLRVIFKLHFYEKPDEPLPAPPSGVDQ